MDKVRPFKLIDANPFSFLRIFCRTKTLATLAASLFFMCFTEGKNLVNIFHVWMDNILGFPVTRKGVHVVLYGLFINASGAYAVPWMMKCFGGRGFTTTANLLNVLGLS